MILSDWNCLVCLAREESQIWQGKSSKFGNRENEMLKSNSSLDLQNLSATSVPKEVVLPKYNPCQQPTLYLRYLSATAALYSFSSKQIGQLCRCDSCMRDLWSCFRQRKTIPDTSCPFKGPVNSYPCQMVCNTKLNNNNKTPQKTFPEKNSTAWDHFGTERQGESQVPAQAELPSSIHPPLDKRICSKYRITLYIYI